MMNKIKKIFLSTPISTINHSSEYLLLRNFLVDLKKTLYKSNDITNIFCAALAVEDNSKLEKPEDSVKQDISELYDSSHFILIFPHEKLCTSALIELGYALCMNIDILILTPNKDHLPYLAKEMDQAYTNVTTLIYKDLSPDATKAILSHLIN